jgi:hypothetical protein
MRQTGDQQRFPYPGFPGGSWGACRLRTFEPDDGEDEWRPVVVATELDDNPGPSVTNAVEQLAGEAWRKLFPTLPAPPVVVEHYQRGRYSARSAQPAAFAMPRLEPIGAAYLVRLVRPEPCWVHLSVQDVAALLGQPVADQLAAESSPRRPSLE